MLGGAWVWQDKWEDITTAFIKTESVVRRGSKGYLCLLLTQPSETCERCGRRVTRLAFGTSSLIICSFIELTVKHCSKGARKRSEKTACPAWENRSMKPETFHHESNWETSGPSRAVQTGKAPLVLIQEPCLQLPRFQQRHDRKPRDEKDKRNTTCPSTRWDLAVLAQLLILLSPICSCPSTQHGSECERWPGHNSDSAVGLLLPDLARSREIQRCWLTSSLAVRFPPKKSLNMARGQSRSSVPDPCTSLWVVVGSPLGWWEGANHPKCLSFCISSKGLQTQFMQVLGVVFSTFPCAFSESFTQELTLLNWFLPK